MTIIVGVSFAGPPALGTIQIVPATDDVQIGAPGQGFTIIGIDNGAPGVENAAVYYQGNHSGARVQSNKVVANGDHGLLTEFGATNSDFVIEGNEFAGQTFLGNSPAGLGFGLQFILANVPRQLVVISGGAGGGNTSDIDFTNNAITGTAGGVNADGDEQGNTLVTIDADDATISDNTFAGTTTRFGTSLRARGPNTKIKKNDFRSAGQTPTSCYAFIQEIGDALKIVRAQNIYDTEPLMFPDKHATTGSICASESL